jgi:MFS superfamily sulfate permease-like transporter
VNVRDVVRYWNVRKSSVLLSLTATLGVIVLGVLEGIALAIFLAVLLFFRRSWWPHGAVLGRGDGIDGWHSVDQLDDLSEVPDVLVYRWEAPLFFANAGQFRQHVRKLVRQREPRWVVLQCEAITDIDVTAAAMLEQLDEELNAAGIHIAFVELRTRLQDLMQRHGLFETLERDHCYPSMEAALAAIDAEGGAADNAVS